MAIGRALPALNALKVFESAARHGSFTRAAAELAVTQAAVSKQVRRLEDELGVELFQRRHRQVVLTAEGRELQVALADAFGRIADTTEKIAAGHGKRLLTVGCGPVFGARWLRSRLPDFRRRHPDIEVNLETHGTLPPFGPDGVDVAIQFGNGAWPGLHAERLMTAPSYPVCSPALMTGRHPLNEPADLVHHTLLHDVPADGWRIWLEAAGIEGVDWSAGPRFRDMTLYIDAAADGEGVALGDDLACARDLEAGRLVRPFDRAVVLGSFYLAAPPAALDRPKIAAFRAWIRESVGG